MNYLDWFSVGSIKATKERRKQDLLDVIGPTASTVKRSNFETAMRTMRQQYQAVITILANENPVADASMTCSEENNERHIDNDVAMPDEHAEIVNRDKNHSRKLLSKIDSKAAIKRQAVESMRKRFVAIVREASSGNLLYEERLRRLAISMCSVAWRLYQEEALSAAATRLLLRRDALQATQAEPHIPLLQSDSEIRALSQLSSITAREVAWYH